MYSMRGVVIVIAIFAFLVFDITKNHGEWSRSVTDLADDTWREFRIALSR